MNEPTWFNQSYYLQQKAAALNTAGTGGRTDWTATEVLQSMQSGGLTPYQHYTAFGAGESLSPNPSFDVTYYLQQKATQLNAHLQPGQTPYTTSTALQAILDAGLTPMEHYEQYGANESLNPNQYFDQAYYLSAKAAELNAASAGGRTDWTPAEVLQSIAGAGLTPYEHFAQFGVNEGLNPSASFDVQAYLQDKADELNQTGGTTTWTPAQVLASLESAGLDPISHYVEYGHTEGVPVTPVTPVTPENPSTPGGGGGGGGGGTTFTVTEDPTTHAITFGGTATGAVTLTTDGTNLTFTRGGIEATTKPLLASLGAGDIPAVTLTAATFATAGLATLLTDGTATVNASGASAGNLTALSNGIAKVAAGSITNLTITAATQSDTETSNLLGKATGALVVATGATATEVGALATNIANIAANGITGDLALTNAVSAANITALFGKYAGTTGSAVITGMSDTQITALVGAKMSATGITGSVTDLNAAALTALAAKAANIGDGTLTGTLALTNAVTDANITALFAEMAAGANGTAVITDMTAAQIAALVGAKMSATGITGSVTNLNAAALTALAAKAANIDNNTLVGTPVLTSAVADTDITTLFAKYGATNGMADITNMSAAQITALDNFKIATAGITGAVTDLNAAALTALAGKAADIADASLTGDLAVANADFSAFSNIQSKLATTANVAISAVANGDTVTVTGFTNASFTGTIAGTTGKFDITAGAGSQTITTAGGDDVITGGAAADILNGGAGANIFKFAAADFSAANTSSSISAADTIGDWLTGTGNTIDFGATSLAAIAHATGTGSPGTADITGTGLATFNADDDTLSEKINAVVNAVGTDAIGTSVVFIDGTDSYLFVVGDATSGIQTGDALIKLTGVTATGLTFNSGDINGF